MFCSPAWLPAGRALMACIRPPVRSLQNRFGTWGRSVWDLDLRLDLWTGLIWPEGVYTIHPLLKQCRTPKQAM